MAPYCEDSEAAETHDQQQTLSNEHTRLLDDQGHASLYRTLSVRFAPNDTLFDRRVEAILDDATTSFDNIHLQTSVLTYCSAAATQNTSHKMTATLRYHDVSL
jgi:hypothetical protein